MDVASFHERGYAIVQDIITPAHAAALRADIDALGPGQDGWGSAVRIAEQPTLGGLTVFAPLVEIVHSLMASHSEGRPSFSFHHQHCARMEPGTDSAVWHHDYEQHPQQNRDLLMVHCFVYPNGLDGQVGDLVLLPRSHTAIIDRGRDVFGGLFGAEPLPGSITISQLPSSSVVIVHSGLLHGRRAKPAGQQAGGVRYFTDLSFCQHPHVNLRAGQAGLPSCGESGRDTVRHRFWPSYQVANRLTIMALGGHAAIFAAHSAHGRDKTPLAQRFGIFDLSVFWDVNTGTAQQVEALQKAPGRRRPRL